MESKFNFTQISYYTPHGKQFEKVNNYVHIGEKNISVPKIMSPYMYVKVGKVGNKFVLQFFFEPCSGTLRLSKKLSSKRKSFGSCGLLNSGFIPKSCLGNNYKISQIDPNVIYFTI